MLVIQDFAHAIMITLFVFVMMLLVDYFNVLTNGKLSFMVKGRQWRQYTITSFLGSTPGCLGAYLNVSFYVHGLISFGAIVGGMVATSGDEGFVMLSLFPGKALLLFILLFFSGIFLAWLTDKLVPLLKIHPCKECKLQVIHSDEPCECFNRHEFVQIFFNISYYRATLIILGLLSLFLLMEGIIGPPSWDWKRITMVLLIAISLFIIGSVPNHYLKEHIWEHIVKKHLFRVFLWTFLALLFVNIALKFLNIEELISKYLLLVLLVSVFVGIIPESGPHMVIVMLFASGTIPFSILVASSIVQDGHGMLPLLSYTVKDSILIKVFNLIYGFLIGLLLLALGW